jgi:hypothetical protein
VIWYILSIQYIKETRDIYSNLRDKLEGLWVANYDYSVAGMFVFPARPKAIFRFVLNQDNKLEMRFDPTDNVIFESVSENISQISLRHEEGNKYALMYFYSSQRKLRPEIAESIERDYPQQDVARVDVEAFGTLTFRDSLGKKEKITKMSGSWYDLNGQMRILGLLLRERAKADAIGALRNYKAKLSSFTDGQVVTAKMGDVIFERKDSLS